MVVGGLRDVVGGGGGGGRVGHDGRAERYVASGQHQLDAARRALQDGDGLLVGDVGVQHLAVDR